MKISDCLPQKMSKMMLISLMLLAAVALIIIGFTLLPVIGFFSAIPLIALAIYVYRLKLNDQCEIDFTEE